MLGIKWTFRRIVATIATFMGIGTLVSCYGVPTDDIYEADMYGMPANYDYKVDGQIEAIKTGKTNDNGYFEYKNIKTAGNSKHHLSSSSKRNNRKTYSRLFFGQKVVFNRLRLLEQSSRSR